MCHQKDMEDGLYGSYHFNFISPISRQRLEDLAMSTIRANAVQQVRIKCAVSHTVLNYIFSIICHRNETFHCMRK